MHISQNPYAPGAAAACSRSGTLTLPVASADTLVLTDHTRALLLRLWEPGTAYHRAGVVLDGLESSATGQQLALF